MIEPMQKTHHLYKAVKLLGATILLFAMAIFPFGSWRLNRAVAQTNVSKVYLPIAAAGYRNSPQVLLGVYPKDYMGTQSNINSNLKDLDNWTGKGTTIAALFMAFEFPNPNYNVPVPLELLWDNGYTPFVNLMTDQSAADIAQGREDNNIRSYASAFAYWAALAQQDGEQRLVFLAPLPEGNITNGNAYGGDPQAFKSAFWRIQDIFADEYSKQNVSFDTIKWVFAPNGVDEPGMPTFEAYYPGHDRTDIVAFSSYNFGYCVGWEYDHWQLGPELYQPFVQRMHSLAPGKPIFIGQTGSTSEYPHPGSFDHGKKSDWFVDVYSYLTGLDGVRAVLYFNIDSGCDWSFFRSGSLYFEGYRQVVRSSAFGYLSPDEMIDAFSVP